MFPLIRAFFRLLLWVFYRRIEVVGAERIPASGPLILAANHHNSVVDALLLMALPSRPVRTLAKAQLFSHPLIGPFLRLAGALPVHRRQESGDDPQKNQALFAATTATLRGGGAILIFPEGRTQPEPVLLELRTGAARMLLAAQAASPVPPVTLLPVGLLFERPGIFREGRAIVLVGEPVDTTGLAEADPARDLTERLATALRGLILEAPDREVLRLVTLVEALAFPDAAPTLRVRRLKQLLEATRWLAEAAPEPLAAFGTKLARFADAMDQAGLPFGELPRNYSAGLVLRFTLRQGLPLLLSAPLAVAGLLLHALPYGLTALAARLIPHTDEEDATDKIAAGLVFYPLAWAAELWLAHHLGGKPGFWVTALLLLPAGFFALAWRERLARLAREARAFFLVLRHPELPSIWTQLRTDLIADLEALAQRLPEALRPQEGPRP